MTTRNIAIPTVLERPLLPRHAFADFSAAAFWAGITAFVWYVFGALTLQIAVLQGLGVSEAGASSWILVTWLTSGAGSIFFSLVYRQPIPLAWSLPGLVYIGSLGGRFSVEEVMAASLVAGGLVLLLGFAGVGAKIIRIIPLPIVMGMFAASILDMVTRMIGATAGDFAIGGAVVGGYIAGRVLSNVRIPAVGLGAILCFGVALASGGIHSPAIAWQLPAVVHPGLELSLSAVVTISLPLVILVLGMGNVQGLGFLAAQGYRVPANAVTVAAGIGSIFNALLGGHPASMGRAGTAIVGGPEAGPLTGRYWANIIAGVLVLGVAISASVMLAVVAALPQTLVVAVAGVAIFGSFQDALERAFSGSLRLGATVAFSVTATSFVVAGISSAFWAIPAGIGVSLLIERDELLGFWKGSAEKSK
jgi:benzoate membrane transport protein